MPGKDGIDRPPAREGTAPRYRRPDDDLLRRAARRVIRGGKASFPSQAAFRRAVLSLVRRDEPLAAVGPQRLRRLLVGAPGVRVSVRYSERPGAPLPTDCPVCGGELRPIYNKTLAGDRIQLGKRCSRCDYWTHENRRVPVRYAISGAGIDGRPLRR